MPYNTNIPQRLDFLSNPSQGQFLENFQQIKALFEQDHVAFNDANQGKHNKTTLTLQDPTKVTSPSSTEYSMFCGDRSGNPLIGNLSLIFNSVSSGGFIPGSYTNADAIFTSYMSLRLPSGILIKWNFQGNITPRHVNSNIFSFDWNRDNDEEKFVTQYWAYVTTNQLTNTSEPFNPIFYVTDISDPSKTQFAVWNCEDFNVRGLIANAPLKVIAIGV